MKRNLSTLFLIMFLMPAWLFSQNNTQGNKTDKVDKLIQKGDNSINKIKNILAVFQPYLLKAREIYYQGKQLAADVKNSKRTIKQLNNSGNQDGNNNTTFTTTSNTDTSSSQQNTYTNSNNNSDNNSNVTDNNNSSSNSSIQNYLPNQNLPINNPATVNNDGTGNWGNQNNGLYGNCLDVMTGTIMGMGDAAQTPTSVDLIFFAPADGQNTYYIMTPGFARNNGTASYMTEHTSDQIQQWSDVNETEVALTKLTIGQFNQIQNNSQIQNAVRNAQNYSGYYSSVEQRLDGKVLAVKVQMDNREVYALIAVVKQIGTSGSNGYLKIMVKSQGIGNNQTGQVDANMYQR